MKFEHESCESTPECVAYIDHDGDLFVLDGNSEAVCLSHTGICESDHNWRPENATHKFYPGDKVTITF